MKAIQVVFDEKLLRRLDADAEVKKFGRSAVLRRAASEYLRRTRARKIADRYRCAYAGREGLGKEFDGWVAEGVWPDE